MDIKKFFEGAVDLGSLMAASAKDMDNYGEIYKKFNIVARTYNGKSFNKKAMLDLFKELELFNEGVFTPLGEILWKKIMQEK